MILATKKLLIINLLLCMSMYAGYAKLKNNNIAARNARNAKVVQMLTLIKKPNIEEVKDLLLAFPQVKIIDVWLDKLAFDEAKYSLEFSVKSITSDKVYLYLAKLQPILKQYKWYVTQTTVKRRDFVPDKSVKKEDNAIPTPFVIDYLKGQMQQESEKETKSKKSSKEDKYKYEASIQASFRE